MKKILFLLPLLYLFSCQKRLNSASDLSPLISRAKAFFTDSIEGHASPVVYRAAQPKSALWDQAQVISLGKGQGVLVPISYTGPMMAKTSFSGQGKFHLNYLTQLLIYGDGSRQKAVVITSFPDSVFFTHPTGPYTGIKFVEDWSGNTIEKLFYGSDGSIRRYTAPLKEAASTYVETCYTIYGYNYGADDKDGGYDWSEDAGCVIQYAEPVDGDADPLPAAVGGNTLGGGSNGSGNASSSTTAINVAPPSSIIANVNSYFQCFTNVGGTDHTYTVTVCVDQPVPGQRTPWTTQTGGPSGSSAANNLFDVGHTFLTLTETYGATTITRNIGYYPSKSVTPLNPSAPSIFGNNQTEAYDISGSFTVTNAQFTQILNFITQYSEPGFNYNLNSNNCTTFVINTLAQAGINLPRTIGTWTDGSGYDPGDLGEDMRNGNIPGMTVNLNGGTGSSHLDVGQCD